MSLDRRKVVLIVFITLNVPLLVVGTYTLLSHLYPAEASYNMHGYHYDDNKWVTRYPAWQGEYTVSIINKDLPENKYIEYKSDVVWAMRYWEVKEDLSFRVVQSDESDIVIVLSEELNNTLLKKYISLPDRILAVGYAIPMTGVVEVKTARELGPFKYEFDHERVKSISRHELGHIFGYSHEDLDKMGIN